MKLTMLHTILLILFLVMLGGCSRDRKSIVAEVGGHEITRDEFKTRYQSFLANGAQRDNILLRKRVLDNMINERLIFEDIQRQGFDRDEQFNRRFEDITNQALLDAYARRISVDTMSLSELELWNEFRISNSKVKARYLYGKSEAEAWNLLHRLKNGETFEALAREVFEDPGLASNGGDLGYFGWGDMEPALEDAAFSIPVGSVSDPVKLNIGYGIVRVDDRIEAPLASEYDYADRKQKLADVLWKKKTILLVKDAARNIEKGLEAKFNEAAVRIVYENWKHVAGDGTDLLVGNESRKGVPIDMSNMPMVSFTWGSWTIGEFLRKAEKTTGRQRRDVKSTKDIKDVAIGLAGREVLLQRARSLDLQGDSLVQKQVRWVVEQYLLKRWAMSVQDTAGQNGWPEDLVRGQFEQNRSQYAYPPEVNVAEILVRTREEAMPILASLKKGADFAELARRNSIRLWAAKRGGELGFGTRSTFGVLGNKFFEAGVGQILGPEFVDPYYGVFKVLERKDGRPKTLDEAKPQIVQELSIARKQEVFTSAVDFLRSRGTVTINDQNLADVVLDAGQSR